MYLNIYILNKNMSYQNLIQGISTLKPFQDLNIDSVTIANEIVMSNPLDNFEISHYTSPTITDEYCNYISNVVSDTVTSQSTTFIVNHTGLEGYNPVLNATLRRVEFQEDGIYLVKLRISNTAAFNNAKSCSFLFRNDANLLADKLEVIYNGDDSVAASRTDCCTVRVVAGDMYSLYTQLIRGIGSVPFTVVVDISRLK